MTPPHQPGHYPRAGHVDHGFPAMRDVDHSTSAARRPGAVVAAFALWLSAALSWPVGTVVRVAVEDGSFAGFGPVMSLFATVCVAVAGVCGAFLLRRGSYHARLALCGVSLVLGVLTVAAVLVAARDGLAEPASWAVLLSRLVLPAAAAVVSFLPGNRHYFAGNIG